MDFHVYSHKCNNMRYKTGVLTLQFFCYFFFFSQGHFLTTEFLEKKKLVLFFKGDILDAEVEVFNINK